MRIVTGITVMSDITTDTLNDGSVYQCTSDNTCKRINSAKIVWVKRNPAKTREIYKKLTDRGAPSISQFQEAFQSIAVKQPKFCKPFVKSVPGEPDQSEDDAFRRLIDLPREEDFRPIGDSGGNVSQGKYRNCCICNKQIHHDIGIEEAWEEASNCSQYATRVLTNQCAEFHCRIASNQKKSHVELLIFTSHRTIDLTTGMD